MANWPYLQYLERRAYHFCILVLNKLDRNAKKPNTTHSRRLPLPVRILPATGPLRFASCSNFGIRPLPPPNFSRITSDILQIIHTTASKRPSRRDPVNINAPCNTQEKTACRLGTSLRIRRRGFVFEFPTG